MKGEERPLSRGLVLLHPFVFKPLAESDLPLIAEWLEAPHLREWWVPAETAFDDIHRSLALDWLHGFLIHHGGEPIGYLQCYAAHGQPDPIYYDLPAGSWGTDQFIGPEALLGRGLGADFLGAFSDWMLGFGPAKLMFTDPETRNIRAIRAYEKAGYRAAGERTSADGRVLVMVKDLTDD